MSTRRKNCLLPKGADDIGTPRSLSCCHLVAACASGNEGLVLLLLKEGANPIRRGCGFLCRSPLGAACKAGRENIIRLLIHEGVKVEDDTNAITATSMEGHKAIVRLLLHESADSNKNKNALTNALEAASREGHESNCTLFGS